MRRPSKTVPREEYDRAEHRATIAETAMMLMIVGPPDAQITGRDSLDPDAQHQWRLYGAGRMAPIVVYVFGNLTNRYPVVRVTDWEHWRQGSPPLITSRPEEAAYAQARDRFAVEVARHQEYQEPAPRDAGSAGPGTSPTPARSRTP